METILVNLMAAEGGPKCKIILKGQTAISIIAQFINMWHHHVSATDDEFASNVTSYNYLETTAYLQNVLSVSQRFGITELVSEKPELNTKVHLFGYRNTQVDLIAEITFTDWAFIEYLQNKFASFVRKYERETPNVVAKVIPTMQYTEQWTALAYLTDQLALALQQYKQGIGTYSISNKSVTDQCNA